jgi:hypothetical protein
MSYDSSEYKKYEVLRYNVDLKDFNDLMDEMKRCCTALVILQSHLSEGKGLNSVFNHPEKGRLLLTPKHLVNALSNYIELCNEMKKYHKYSMKKKDPVIPESFRGVYSPVFCADALRNFFTDGDFGALSPAVAKSQHPQKEIERLLEELRIADENFALVNDEVEKAGDEITTELTIQWQMAKQDYESLAHVRMAKELAQGDNTKLEEILKSSLIKSLQLVKDGYVLHNTITLLFYIFTHANNLQKENAQFISSNAHMDKQFGGTTAAAFYKKKVGSKSVKFLMADAVAQKLIKEPVNTYHVVKELFPEGTKNKKGEDTAFNPTHFNTYYWQNIASLNYYSQEELGNNESMQKFLDYIQEDNVRGAMLNDHIIIKAVNREWGLL